MTMPFYGVCHSRSRYNDEHSIYGECFFIGCVTFLWSGPFYGVSTAFFIESATSAGKAVLYPDPPFLFGVYT